MGRPDIVMGRPAAVDVAYEPVEAEESTAVGVLDVEVPTNDKLQEWYLEIHDVETGTLVTALEILSPFNKIHAKGREAYIKKRKRVFGSMTNLVEIDLLRAGEPMPLDRKPPRTDYRMLVRRGATHPKAKLYTFNVRQPIPLIPIPLLPEDDEPELDLGARAARALRPGAVRPAAELREAAGSLAERGGHSLGTIDRGNLAPGVSREDFSCPQGWADRSGFSPVRVQIGARHELNVSPLSPSRWLKLGESPILVKPRPEPKPVCPVGTGRPAMAPTSGQGHPPRRRGIDLIHAIERRVQVLNASIVIATVQAVGLLAEAPDLQAATVDRDRPLTYAVVDSIVDYTRAPDSRNPKTRGPAIDPVFLTTESEASVWSSTTHLEGPGPQGGAAAYIAFGRAMGYRTFPGGSHQYLNVHGAGAQRSDPKSGDPKSPRWASGMGPQGDEIRILNFARAVRNLDPASVRLVRPDVTPLPIARFGPSGQGGPIPEVPEGMQREPRPVGGLPGCARSWQRHSAVRPRRARPHPIPAPADRGAGNRRPRRLETILTPDQLQRFRQLLRRGPGGPP